MAAVGPPAGLTDPNFFFNDTATTEIYTPSVSGLAATLAKHAHLLAPGTALADKAAAIQTAVNASPPQTATACAGITNLLGLVNAQTGKKLSAKDANTLTTDATSLATALGGCH
jgi:hypothetical protein